MNLPDMSSQQKSEDENKIQRVDRVREVDVVPVQNANVSKMDVINGGIELLDSIVEATNKYNEYRQTREKWQGRVKEAKVSLKEAKLELEQTKDSNNVKRQQLEIARSKLEHLIDFMNELKTKMDGQQGEDMEKLLAMRIQMAELISNI